MARVDTDSGNISFYEDIYKILGMKIDAPIEVALDVKCSMLYGVPDHEVTPLMRKAYIDLEEIVMTKDTINRSLFN